MTSYKPLVGFLQIYDEDALGMRMNRLYFEVRGQSSRLQQDQIWSKITCSKNALFWQRHSDP